jgi:hypothetical protein
LTIIPCMLLAYKLHLPPSCLMTRVLSAELCCGSPQSQHKCQEGKRLANSSFWNKSLKTRGIFMMFKKTKDSKNIDVHRCSHRRCRICVKTLASAHGMSAVTIFAILHEDLGLIKKSVRWLCPSCCRRTRWTGEWRHQRPSIRWSRTRARAF